MSLVFPIVGAYHRPPAQTLLNNLSLNTRLILRPEPGNFYDPNAIAIWVPRESFPNQNPDLEASIQSRGLDVVEFFSQMEFQVGYLPREIAAELAPKLREKEILELYGTFGVTANGKPQVKFNLED